MALNLYPPGVFVLFTDSKLFFSLALRFFLCVSFYLFRPLNPRPFVQSWYICARHPKAATVANNCCMYRFFFCFFLFFRWRCRFFRVLCSFFFVRRVCMCVFSSHSFWTSSSLDVPAGVTQAYVFLPDGAFYLVTTGWILT